MSTSPISFDADVKAMMDADLWSEHPFWVRASWRDAVMEEDTTSGYWDWVQTQIDLVRSET